MAFIYPIGHKRKLVYLYSSIKPVFEIRDCKIEQIWKCNVNQKSSFKTLFYDCFLTYE